MSDRYGTTLIPAETPDAGEAAGDRALNVCLDFFETFINRSLARAWASVAPPKTAGFPTPREMPVSKSFTHDPERGSFNEASLPALYLYRKRGKPEWIAEDWRVSKDELTLLWVFPPATTPAQRQRDVIANVLAKSLDVAIERYRDPYWVHERDKADADAFKRAVATSTSAQVYAADALDGIIGTKRLVSPRHFTVSTALATGAYALLPIVATGVVDGEPATDSVTPTTVDGGEILVGSVAFDSIAVVSTPAMTSVDGSMQFGHDADASALANGSLLLEHCGFQALKLREWDTTTISIRLDEKALAKTYDAVRTYPAVKFTLDAEERWTVDMDEHFDRIDGIDANITRSDGTLYEQARFDAP